jgi:hypothetical protein
LPVLRRLFEPLRRARVAAIVMIALGCAPWARIPAPAPARLPTDTRYQLWLGHRAILLRGVIVDVDSIRGHPVEASGASGTGWLVVSRAEVDSFRMRPPDRQNWFGTGITVGLLAGIAVTAALFHWLQYE